MMMVLKLAENFPPKRIKSGTTIDPVLVIFPSQVGRQKRYGGLFGQLLLVVAAVSFQRRE
jgi:hypothetical protein